MLTRRIRPKFLPFEAASRFLRVLVLREVIEGIEFNVGTLHLKGVSVVSVHVVSITLLNVLPFPRVQAGCCCCGGGGGVGLDVLVHVVGADVLQLREVRVEVLLAAADHA